MRIIDSTQEILKSYRRPSSVKRNRIKLTDEQKGALEETFKMNRHPTIETKELLEFKYSIPIKNIQIWFQNRRAKERSFEEEEKEKGRKYTENIWDKEKYPISYSYNNYNHNDNNYLSNYSYYNNDSQYYWNSNRKNSSKY
ncbi:hypothetical protein H311_03552 [Anncaliia algerae PRA109]|nr:hypothetical protein H311_03552 [Anncaliia algerae PRA109]